MDSEINEPTDQEPVGEALLQVVAQTLPRRGTAPPQVAGISLDTPLDNGLGFDSLTRAELLMNVEHRFGIQLPEALLNEVRTPRDILNAIAKARGRPPSNRSQTPQGEAVPPESTDVDHKHFTRPPVATLQQALLWHAHMHPQRTYLHWVINEKDNRPLSFGDLHDGSLQIANGLFQHNLALRDTVALMLPTGHDFFYGLYGTLYANAIPAPLPSPEQATRLEEHLQSQAATLNDARPRIMITIPEVKQLAGLLKTLVPSLEEVVTTDDLWGNALMHPVASAGGNETALLLYTSGGCPTHPEGIRLSHTDLFARIALYTDPLGLDQDDVVVSWLPLHHEVGLIGTCLSSLWLGLQLVVMAPGLFLAEPRYWLWAIHHFQGTLSLSPAFGYELCLQGLGDKDLKGLNLHSWRVAFKGAMAADPGPMERFAQRFAHWGFNPETIISLDALTDSRVMATTAGTAPAMQRTPQPVGRGTGILTWGRIRNALYAGWAWFAFGLTGLLTVVGVNILPRRRWRWRVVRLGGRALGWLTGTRLHLNGRDKLAALPEGCVVVANHASYVDVLIIAAVMPEPIRFVAKAELQRFAFLRRLFRLVGVETVDRSTDQSKVRAYRRIAEHAQGRRLLYFPEGSFDSAPGIQPFQMGAFLTAVVAQEPILPIVLKGTRNKLPASRWNPRPGAVEVVVGNLIWPEGNSWHEATRLRQRARNAIVSMSDEPDRLGRLQPRA
ncbi:AMP-binding protein [Halomonadaceae bacterium KBTZ08]